MKRKKHIVIAKLFDSGGMNSYLRTLVHYLGGENIILVLENEQQLDFLKKTVSADIHQIKILPKLYGFAHLSYYFSTNVREYLMLLRSVAVIFFLSLRNGNADITVSVAEPEKYLYLLWTPFLKVTYILHSEPKMVMSWFTTLTCNCRLDKKRRIVTVSRAMKDAICQFWHISLEKRQFVKIIYNCLPEYGQAEPGDNRLLIDKLLISTLGHVDDRKNPGTWLKVAQKVLAERHGVEFVWLGNGPLLDEFEALTRNDPQVSFPGMTENVMFWLNKSTIYYQPSLTEPHGIAVVEAMSVGLPCVVARTGGLPESVRDGYNGIVVDPLDITAHVNALTRLLDDTRMRDSFGANAIKRYHQLFTFSRFKEKMNEIYA